MLTAAVRGGRKLLETAGTWIQLLCPVCLGAVLLREQLWRRQSLWNGVWEAICGFLPWFGCIPQEGSKLPAQLLDPAGQHSPSAAAQMLHPASMSFIFRLCLLLSHLLLCGLATISQEQMARDGGETSLLIPAQGLALQSNCSRIIAEPLGLGEVGPL